MNQIYSQVFINLGFHKILNEDHDHSHLNGYFPKQTSPAYPIPTQELGTGLSDTT